MSHLAYRVFLLTMPRAKHGVSAASLHERVEALCDAGFAVESIDLNDGPRSSAEIIGLASEAKPQVFIIDAVDCSAAHAASLGLAKRIKAALPATRLVYAGAHPCANWREVLLECAAIDLIVRGEELRTLVWLARAIVTHGLVATVPGVAYRSDGAIRATRRAKPLMRDVPAWRVLSAASAAGTSSLGAQVMSCRTLAANLPLVRMTHPGFTQPAR